jgi:hypothetical protein
MSGRDASPRRAQRDGQLRVKVRTSGELVAKKIGTSYRVKRSELNAFLSR